MPRPQRTERARKTFDDLAALLSSSPRTAKCSVKTGLRLLKENYTEAGVDCEFYRAAVSTQGCPRGPRKSEGNPPVRTMARLDEIIPACRFRCCGSNRWSDRMRDRR